MKTKNHCAIKGYINSLLVLGFILFLGNSLVFSQMVYLESSVGACYLSHEQTGDVGGIAGTLGAYAAFDDSLTLGLLASTALLGELNNFSLFSNTGNKFNQLLGGLHLRFEPEHKPSLGLGFLAGPDGLGQNTWVIAPVISVYHGWLFLRGIAKIPVDASYWGLQFEFGSMLLLGGAYDSGLEFLFPSPQISHLADSPWFRNPLQIASRSDDKNWILSYTDGTSYFGQVDQQVPHGNGTIITKDQWKINGNFVQGVLEGSVRIIKDHIELRGNFTQNVPDGEFMLYSNGKLEEKIVFSKGSRLDYPEQAQNLWLNYLESVELISSETNNIDHAIQQIEHYKRTIQELLAPEAILHAIGIRNLPFKISSDGSTWKFSYFAEKTIRNQEGKILSISSDSSNAALSQGKIALWLERSEKTLHDNPLKNLSFISAAASYYSDFSSLHAINAFGEFRNVYNPNLFPGKQGGFSAGLDTRIKGGIGLYILDRSDFQGIIVNAETNASLGWSFLRFNALDQDSLRQEGNGFTIAALLGARLALREHSKIQLYAAPLLCYDLYQYNPASLQYKSQTIGIYIVPFPFSLSLFASISL